MNGTWIWAPYYEWKDGNRYSYFVFFYKTIKQRRIEQKKSFIKQAKAYVAFSTFSKPEIEIIDNDDIDPRLESEENLKLVRGHNETLKNDGISKRDEFNDLIEGKNIVDKKIQEYSENNQLALQLGWKIL